MWQIIADWIMSHPDVIIFLYLGAMLYRAESPNRGDTASMW